MNTFFFKCKSEAIKIDPNHPHNLGHKYCKSRCLLKRTGRRVHINICVPGQCKEFAQYVFIEKKIIIMCLHNVSVCDHYIIIFTELNLYTHRYRIYVGNSHLSYKRITRS